jgi:hypothetical protein
MIEQGLLFGGLTMKVMHRITLNTLNEADSFIEPLQIKHKRVPLLGGGALIVFEMDESDPRWPEVAQIARQRSMLDLVDTVFTDQEILDAEWVRLDVRFEQGYPQPEEDMAWKRIVYDQECPKCGIGHRQKAPFRLAKEPRLGRHDFMSLFWAETVFCTPRVLGALVAAEIRGYEAWCPIIHSSGESSQTVYQLVVSNVAKPGLAKEDRLQPEWCWRCRTTKYRSHLRGYMHLQRKALRHDVDMLLTHEWFGSGRFGGYREILVSNRVARLILENRWRGVQLKPVELV